MQINTEGLMHLIFDNVYIEAFGDCGVMLRYGNCAVEPLTITEPALLRRNEAATL